MLRLFVILLLILAASGFWWYTDNSPGSHDETRLVLYGNVDIREVNLSFNNSEHISQLLVQEGDRVHKDQLLAKLHQARAQAEVNASAARVAAKKSALARLERGSRPEEVRQARANVTAAKAKLEDANKTYKRIQELFTKKVISNQAVDDARANMDTARANLKVAKESLALAIEGPRIEDIDEAKSLLKVDEAQLALAQEILKDTELYSPDDGVIRDRILEVGDMVTPQTPVFTLALTNPVWVRAYAPETKLGNLVPGMAAEVSTDSYPNKRYQGWIGFISPTAEFTPKNVETPELRTRLVYQVRVYVCNPNDELRLGMPATVSIALGKAKEEPDQTTRNCIESRDH